MDLKKLSAVVADGHKPSRDIVADALRTLGIRDVRQANDGGHAFRLICANAPDIAFFEFEMPDSGLKALKLVRQTIPHRALPIVMMSAFTDSSYIAALRDAGATEIISKPLSLSKICSRVTAIVERPRPFIDCETYAGPCRRRRDDSYHRGPFRRASDQDFFESDSQAPKARNVIRFRG